LKWFDIISNNNNNNNNNNTLRGEADEVFGPSWEGIPTNC